MRRWAMVLLCGALWGCEEPLTTAQRTQRLAEGPLAFLQDGKTTRSDVVKALGLPAMALEGERVWSYRVTYGEKGGMLLVPRNQDGGTWQTVTCSVVLVFDEQDVLREHGLVPMRQEIRTATK